MYWCVLVGTGERVFRLDLDVAAMKMEHICAIGLYVCCVFFIFAQFRVKVNEKATWRIEQFCVSLPLFLESNNKNMKK